ncbi:MAG: AI-2E family transporter [Tannerella sp.]|jgi:predicted PurR-regulated permease PerM|nr:AI-2E family transporter [Tannerella sp.]
MNSLQASNGNYSAFFRQLFFLLLLIFLSVIIWRQLSFFVGCFLGAITLYVVFRLPMFYLIEKKHWWRWIASLLLVVAISLVLLGIGFFVYQVVASEVSTIDLTDVQSRVEEFLGSLSEYIKYPILPKDIFANSKDILTKLASGLLNTAYSFIFNLFMMMIVLYFMLANGRKMEKIIIDHLPFEQERVVIIKSEVKHMIYSNAVGLPLIMLVQGIVAGLGYWMLGVDNVIFWAFLTALLGLLPVVGTAGIWVPLAISLLLNHEMWQGIVLLLYGILIITNADNVCRLVLMKKMADTHPLIVIFGVILGIPLFGFWGIIFGPLFISGFLLLIKIYNMEYGKKNFRTR